MKVALVFVGIIVLGLVGLGGSYVSAYNYANSLENEIVFAWENNENILAQYSQKIQEAAQITEMQRDDVARVLTGAIEARYGAEGSQATMQWIQEQNPNLDSTVYQQIMQIIEAGRNDFQMAQSMLIDKKRAYNTALGMLIQGSMMRVAGFPRIDLDDYQAITTSRAQDTFESGIEKGPINLRN